MLLSIGFSTIANAEEVEIPDYQVMQINSLFNSYGDTDTLGALIFYPKDDENQKFSSDRQDDKFTSYSVRNSGYHQSTFLISFIEKEFMCHSGKTYKIKLNNIYHSLLVSFRDNLYYSRTPSEVQIFLVTNDDKTQLITDYNINHTPGTPYTDLTFDFVAEGDIQQIIVNFKSYLKTDAPSSFYSQDGWPVYTSYWGETGDESLVFYMEISSEESGLLKSLIEWIKGIKSKIDDMFTNVSNGFSNIANSIGNVVNNIIELPLKLWTLISDGLKNLFVPSADEMAEYSDKWDTLLSSRFGALYQSGELVENVVNAIQNQPATVAENGVINMPQVSLDSFGIPFTFGGFDIDIKPDGFEFLITLCKRTISIVCTLAFVNVLRKRYETIVG